MVNVIIFVMLFDIIPNIMEQLKCFACGNSLTCDKHVTD